MNTNTVVLIVVVLIVVLVLAGVVVGFRHRLRAEQRLLGGTSLLDEVVEDARAAQREDVVDHVPGTTPAAQPKDRVIPTD